MYRNVLRLHRLWNCHSALEKSGSIAGSEAWYWVAGVWRPSIASRLALLSESLTTPMVSATVPAYWKIVRWSSVIPHPFQAHGEVRIFGLTIKHSTLPVHAPARV